MNKQENLSNMFKDLNRPEGVYGDVYDKQTRSKDRFVTKPYNQFTWFEDRVAQIAVEELLKEINKKYERT